VFDALEDSDDCSIDEREQVKLINLVCSEYPRAATLAGLDGSQPFLINPHKQCLFERYENDL
jgi:hypothetical protein